MPPPRRTGMSPISRRSTKPVASKLRNSSPPPNRAMSLPGLAPQLGRERNGVVTHHEVRVIGPPQRPRENNVLSARQRLRVRAHSPRRLERLAANEESVKLSHVRREIEVRIDDDPSHILCQIPRCSRLGSSRRRIDQCRNRSTGDGFANTGDCSCIAGEQLPIACGSRTLRTRIRIVERWPTMLEAVSRSAGLKEYGGTTKTVSAYLLQLACAWHCFNNNLRRLVVRSDPDKSAVDRRTFGTTVVPSAGLRGTVYAIPEDTTVLPDFEHDPVQRLHEIWTNTLNVPPRHVYRVIAFRFMRSMIRRHPTPQMTPAVAGTIP
jgi:hypothetical protein